MRKTIKCQRGRLAFAGRNSCDIEVAKAELAQAQSEVERIQADIARLTVCGSDYGRDPAM
jgi:hypothetical protein